MDQINNIIRVWYCAHGVLKIYLIKQEIKAQQIADSSKFMIAILVIKK